MIADQERFGHYQLHEELGRGGMAVVYKAVDVLTNQTVALKILHEFYGAQPSMVKRFQREGELAQSLDHPNIIPIYSYGEIDGRFFITMPYMSKGSLADAFNQPKRVSLKNTAHLLKQIAAALDYAHARGIIHRDLKLENILLDEDMRPVLSDFGIARLQNGTRLTATGIVAGTPLYMSPEQALGRQDIDHRADVYAFAVMTYLMTTGFHPFTGNDALAVLNKHVSLAPPLPTKVNPQLPPPLNAVMQRGLAKHPDKRYDSAGEFVEDFVRVVQGDATTTRTLVDIVAPNPIETPLPDAQPITAIDAPPPRKTNNSNLPFFGLLGIGAILVALALLFAGGGDNSQAAPLLDETEIANRIVFNLTQTAEAEPGLISVSQSTRESSGRATLPPTWTPTTTKVPSQTPTVTQTSSPTPIPSDTAIPTPEGNAIVIGTQGVNLRRGPSIRFGLVANIPADTTLNLVGRTADATWYEVETFDGKRGWGYRDFIQVTMDVLFLPITWHPRAEVDDPISDGGIVILPGQATNTPFPSATHSGGGGGGSNPTATPHINPTLTPRPAITAVTDDPSPTAQGGLNARVKVDTTVHRGPSAECPGSPIAAGMGIIIDGLSTDRAWFRAKTNVAGARAWIRVSVVEIFFDPNTLPILNVSGC